MSNKQIKHKEDVNEPASNKSDWHVTRAGFWVFGLGCLIMLPLLALPDLYPEVFKDNWSLLASFPLRALLGLPGMLFILGMERLLLRNGVSLLVVPSKK